MIYEAIGRAVVKVGLAYVRQRYGTQIRFAIGFGVVAILIGAYLASRDVAEG